MPVHYSRRLSPTEIETDQATLVAVKTLTDYNPANGSARVLF
jgi:hypothetical protein